MKSLRKSIRVALRREPSTKEDASVSGGLSGLTGEEKAIEDLLQKKTLTRASSSVRDLYLALWRRRGARALLKKGPVKVSAGTGARRRGPTE